MKEKLIIFAALLLAIAVYAASPTWTTPSKVAVAAFAVDEYSKYYKTGLRTKSLKRSIYHRDMFIDSLFAKVGRKYPGKRAFTTYKLWNSEARKEDYGEALLYRSEFVFFSGHGDQQKICLYDYPINISRGCGRDVCPNDEGGKVYGGDIRWVILDACLTLNVNKSDKLEYPLTVGTVDFSKVDKLREVFVGVHAILGFYSLSWEDYRYRLSTPQVFARSEDLYKYFTKYFIEDDETIWDSFNMASADIVRDFSSFNGKGLKPAIAFLRGHDKEGRYHDTSQERFNHTFNQPIQINGDLELFVMYDEHGDPEYYSSTTLLL